MFRKLLQTPKSGTMMLLRLVLGVVFFAHGAQKLLGWFGGYGFHGTMAMFTSQLGIPAGLAFLVIVAEFFGGLGLILGFLSRIAAFGIAIEMLVAVFLVHAPNGFFMNWSGNQRGEGFEYHLLALAMCTAVMIKGAGAFSIDRAVAPGIGTEAATPISSPRAA